MITLLIRFLHVNLPRDAQSERQLRIWQRLILYFHRTVVYNEYTYIHAYLNLFIFTNYFENTNMLNLLGAQGILKIHTFDNNIRFYSLPNKNSPDNPPCINDFNLI